MARMIKVKSTFKKEKDGGFQIALSEKDDAHPDGEIFIADDQVHEVAATAGVMSALHEKRLVDVTDGEEDEEDDAFSSSRQLGAGAGDEEPADMTAEASALAKDHTREELDVMAKGLNIDPTAYSNKDALALAIANAQVR